MSHANCTNATAVKWRSLAKAMANIVLHTRNNIIPFRFKRKEEKRSKDICIKR